MTWSVICRLMPLPAALLGLGLEMDKSEMILGAVRFLASQEHTKVQTFGLRRCSFTWLPFLLDKVFLQCRYLWDRPSLPVILQVCWDWSQHQPRQLTCSRGGRTALKPAGTVQGAHCAANDAEVVAISPDGIN